MTRSVQHRHDRHALPSPTFLSLWFLRNGSSTRPHARVLLLERPKKQRKFSTGFQLGTYAEPPSPLAPVTEKTRPPSSINIKQHIAPAVAATAVPACPTAVLEIKVIELEVVGVLVDELLPWAHVISHQDRENPGQREGTRTYTNNKRTTEDRHTHSTKVGMGPGGWGDYQLPRL